MNFKAFISLLTALATVGYLSAQGNNHPKMSAPVNKGPGSMPIIPRLVLQSVPTGPPILLTAAAPPEPGTIPIPVVKLPRAPLHPTSTAKGAQVTMMAAKASFISAQGTKITLAWYAGNDYSQGWVQSTSDLQRLPFTNVFSFGMNAQQVTNTFLSTTPQRFFRLSWVKQTNQFE